MRVGEGFYVGSTADSVLTNMLSSAIGMDNPMTDEAVKAGEAILHARLQRAGEVLAGTISVTPETYDSEAVAAYILIQNEKLDDAL